MFFLKLICLSLGLSYGLFCCPCQNELRMLFTALSESKHQLLQKMAATVDRPASKQIEV